MNEDRTGDKAGYVLLELDPQNGRWITLDSDIFPRIIDAVDVLKDYEVGRPRTYAVGRIELAMISRPETEPADV